jgi:hypothetical protein
MGGIFGERGSRAETRRALWFLCFLLLLQGALLVLALLRRPVEIGSLVTTAIVFDLEVVFVGYFANKLRTHSYPIESGGADR